MQDSPEVNINAVQSRKVLRYSARRFLLTIGAALIAILSGYSQTQVPPKEILKLLKKSDRDTHRVDLLVQLADYYIESEWNYSNKEKVDSALPYLLEAKKISDSIHSTDDLCKVLRSLGNYYFRCDKPDLASVNYTQLISLQRAAGEKESEAINWQLFAFRTPALEIFLDTIVYRYQQALTICKSLKNFESQVVLSGLIGGTRIAQGKLLEAEHALVEGLDLPKDKLPRSTYLIYWQLSRLHRKKGNYNKAIQYGLKAIDGVKPDNNDIVEAVYTDGVGRLYADIGKPHLALSFFYAALNILDHKSESDWHAKNERYDIINQMVPAFLESGRAKDALVFLQQAGKKNPPGNDYTKLLFSVAMGNCNNGLKRFDDAERYFMQALTIAVRTGQVVEEVNILFLLAKLNITRKRYPDASQFISRLLKHPNGLATAINQSEISLLQFKIDSATGDFLAAIKNYQNYKAVNDSIFTVEKIKQLDELQIQYQSEKNAQEILVLQNKTKVQTVKLSSEALVKKITFAGIALLLVILILLQRAYRIKQRINRQLEKSQEKINQTNLSLLKLVHEKEWLVKEIHHRVKNNLHTIMSLLDSQTAYLLNNGEKNAIRDSQRRIQAMSLLHQKLYLAKDMNCVNMLYYIHELVSSLKDSFNTEERVQFELNVEPVILNVTPAVTLALILNEAITNALKYAFPAGRPGLITVSLKKEGPDHYRLCIIDNGIGLPGNFDIARDASLGLTLMQGFAIDIDGHFNLKSEKGTHIKIDFSANSELSSLNDNTEKQLNNENTYVHR